MVSPKPDSFSGLKSLILKTDTRCRVRTPASRREALLAEFDASGLSGKQFARLCGINYSTFQYWIQCRKRRSEPGGSRPAARQEPVAWLEAVVQQAMPPAGSGLTLQFAGGVRAEITTQEQALLAASLLRALQKPC